jgi:penicillin amidase
MKSSLGISIAVILGLAVVGKPLAFAQQATTPLAPPPTQSLAQRATIALAQHDGTLTAAGLHHPVQVLRDQWGVPHIYAQDTWDLFFAQGFVAAQDHMWQMEMWRRAGEGKLAEVLGPEYVERDKFARLLAFRGDWNAELRKYHPDGPEIFIAFARGINSAIEVAIEQQKVPIEFSIMGIQPEPSWTAKTVLTRMPAWTLSRNASSELARALAVKAYGVEKAEPLFPTTPHKALEIPAGLDLDDIVPQILDISKGAGSLNWKFAPPAKPAAAGPAASSIAPGNAVPLFSAPGGEADNNFDLGSNNWVIGGAKSATGMPLLSNDPHREVFNPALRMLVHLNAPGWNDIGVTEPGFPGISIGHNDDIAWGFTILGVDQQDIYVEETDPADPDRYMYKGQWTEMTHDRQLIHVKPDQFNPVVYDVKTTIHGPVLYEDKAKHRAYTLKWVGSEPGGAGYLGSLNVMQAKNWDEFRTDVAKSWYLPSHSLVYADTKGNYGYVAAALSPVRKNWDGLLPVPGKDGKYEWDGFVPLLDLPHQLNGGKGFYASANNDVVPKIFPNYKVPLGYEYSAPFRFDRITEVLSENKKFSIEDLEQLQQDHMSLPARQLVPLFKGLSSDKPGVQNAIDKLRAWNFVVDKNAVTPTIYEYWLLKLTPLIYAPHLPEGLRAKFNRYDVRNVIQWMTHPDKTLWSDPVAARNSMMLAALQQALDELHTKFGDDESKWVWGDIHEARFEHPLLTAANKSVFGIAPVRRGGDAYTVQATSNPTEKGADEEHGASAQFVMDVKDWDNSVGLNAPGNSAQPESPHYADLAPLWGDGKFFPLAFSKAKVEAVTKDRLLLYPEPESEAEDQKPAFERVQTDLFTEERPISLAWGDYDNDGWPDLFVGYFGGMVKLFHNDHGKFVDVSVQAGITDANAVRAAAWGDFDGDGNLDLYVGFAFNSTTPNRLYKGDGHGHFVDVAQKMGINDWGETRQTTFVDFNNDGRPDLFVAFREKESRLYRNDGDHFTEVAKQMGITGSRSTVGAVWFDYNEDGRLDLFEADQNGQKNVVYRNDGDHFTEVGKQLGLDGGDRSIELGSVSIAVGDFNNDGRLDLFYANYGPSWLMRNDAPGKFTDVAAQMGVIVNRHLVSCGWGDYDNDGKLDLYTDGYLVGHPNIRDYLFHNEGDHFTDATPGYMLKNDADHAIAWADYDHDGALDLVLANHEVGGKLSLYHNTLPPEQAGHSLQVLVLDEQGHYTKAGSEVRLYVAGTRQIIAAAQVDTGSSYDGQSALPVHFGLGKDMKVDVEVTTMSNHGRLITRAEAIDTASLHGSPLIIKAK